MSYLVIDSWFLIVWILKELDQQIKGNPHSLAGVLALIFIGRLSNDDISGKDKPRKNEFVFNDINFINVLKNI